MKNEISKTKHRRDFLKTSAILTGGALLSGIPLAGAYASGSDVIKVALIGCGSRGTGAAFQALSTKFNLKLVAMADAFPDKLEKSYQTLLTKFGAEKISVPADKKFVGFEGYIAAMQDADVVMLCTPPGFRPAHFAEAVKQNKQIFMEKPVATDSPGIRSVLATAEEAKRKKLNVVVGLQRHYQKNYREIIDRVHQGGIGCYFRTGVLE
ncbi:MAG TPA: Gfo/Idh/MocA family oxidoreductase [Daejeonella sp.]|nr:Gfo/Idh/MocA family oxidoreductase [Daejeonella sp.]